MHLEILEISELIDVSKISCLAIGIPKYSPVLSDENGMVSAPGKLTYTSKTKVIKKLNFSPLR